ncbi:NAD-dependent epimerase/dehydratase family protein [Tamlana sp. s12]|uniref:NAD-dependent epimerase/dehydratase family protein n=1 Tax=Tamlana sp. s12 TaxID=1630406 RepID=UPI0007FC5FEB|nr:NAD-dependent epimerase/dehydratase family protein [Tamlana sp. s12]OBQ55582.1 capsule biosynthesis protein CapI [Tamlana sp. s12]QQY83740.1 NAD-dependent epimerase/dehydratase family protein [Tamlana sp. s12]
MQQTILVTGAAGFIGFHLCKSLLKKGYNIVGLDNINDYYDINLKFSRLKELGFDQKDTTCFNKITESEIYGSRMSFIRMNLEDRTELPKLFSKFTFNSVCNLAAQAGVRFSLENPEAYIDSNVVGFLNLLEACRHNGKPKLVYASSSSVYGNNDSIPFKESDDVSRPISLYAATKKSNELMAYTYSHLYSIETIGLRFFTVYGPWGRPDMAMFLFTDAIEKDQPIKVFNEGNLSRDFTYIDDIINGVTTLLINKNKKEELYRLYNIGNNKPVKLLDFILAIENKLEKTARKEMLPMQPGDVEQTWADVNLLQKEYNYNSSTSIIQGVSNYVDWFLNYYKTK